MKIHSLLDDIERTLVRPTSKAVFNSQYALEALVVIAQEKRFYQGLIAKQTGCEPSYAGEFIKRLEAAHLVESLPKEPGQSRKYYRRLPSPIWQFCIDLAAHLLAEAPPGVARFPKARARVE
jgi:DNA-binding MarR family transcriptional regulator